MKPQTVYTRSFVYWPFFSMTVTLVYDNDDDGVEYELLTLVQLRAHW